MSVAHAGPTRFVDLPERAALARDAEDRLDRSMWRPSTGTPTSHE
jgi:hypothetical protein